MIDVLRHGAVGVLRLNRAEKANAYDAAHLARIEAGVGELTDCAVVVIQAVGRTFCAGADLKELEARRAEGNWAAALSLRSQAVFTALARAPFVSVASVQGPAVAGGFELALACDLRVVGPRALFSLPETSIGIVPSAGGLTRLARLCGVSVAKGVVLGGQLLDADVALKLGLAHKLGDDDLALQWAGELSKRSREAQLRAKERLDAGESEVALLLERSAQAGRYGE